MKSSPFWFILCIIFSCGDFGAGDAESDVNSTPSSSEASRRSNFGHDCETEQTVEQRVVNRKTQTANRGTAELNSEDVRAEKRHVLQILKDEPRIVEVFSSWWFRQLKLLIMVLLFSVIIFCGFTLIQDPPNNHKAFCVENAVDKFNISKRDLYTRKAKSSLREWKVDEELVVLTFVGFPVDSATDDFYNERFRTFKTDVAGCFIGQSNVPQSEDVIQASPAMTSMALQKQINSLMHKFEKLIWVEKFEVLPGPSLQLLRKYTDEFDPSAEKNLVILSFSISPLYSRDPGKDPEKVAKDYLRDLFSNKLEKVEVDPYLARVANNLFPFVLLWILSFWLVNNCRLL